MSSAALETKAIALYLKAMQNPDSDPLLDVPDLHDDEEDLPELVLEEDVPCANGLKTGVALIRSKVKIAPRGPGVYRMFDAEGAVLYIGKAKSIAKRLASYTRPTGLVTRIARMVARTVEMEFISTKTEMEALLLEANLIKQLKPRFNVLLRDDKSFPYILITGDHAAPQIVRHRGARTRKGEYFGPFASGVAVFHTVNALQRAFLLRTCTDSVYESRSRPCLLHQIKRCAAPCTGEVSTEAYGELVEGAKDFLNGKSHAVRARLALEMEQAAELMEFERAAVYRDRLAALSAVQQSQGINPRGVDEADVFAAYQEGGQTCIEVFFFRMGQNWGNRAYYPRADKSLTPGEVMGPFLAQFYMDKPLPKLIMLSHEVEDQALLQQVFSEKLGRKVEMIVPQRGEKYELVERAFTNAREALGRRLAETNSQLALLEGVKAAFGLDKVPQRIEVYDNSHVSGTSAVGGMIVAGPQGFAKKDYRKFNIKSTEISSGDDFGMMREVLERRFARLKRESLPQAHEAVSDAAEALTTDTPAWPDLVLIDGGTGQLNAAAAILEALELSHIPLVGVAKGRDREAGRETFHMKGREPFRLEARDPILYFLQRLRDEAHRYAIGTHRTKRAKNMREGGLNEIAGIGPSRKRALLNHFGTVKMMEAATFEELRNTPGINDATARAVFNFFHKG